MTAPLTLDLNRENPNQRRYLEWVVRSFAHAGDNVAKPIDVAEFAAALRRVREFYTSVARLPAGSWQPPG